MSYRLITKALFTIHFANGVSTPMSRIVECRAYPAPKRDAAGTITVDGGAVPYKRTGGKGRGTIDNRYMYAVVKGVPAFWAITSAEADALPQATMLTLDAVTEAQAPADEQTKQPAAATEKPKGEQAPRRQKKGEAVAA